MTAEFPAFGLRRDAVYAGGKVRTRYTLMPLTMFNSVYDPDGGWMTHIARRVPVGDESHVAKILLLKIWARELRAFAAGEPVKDRLRPEDLMPTHG